MAAQAFGRAKQGEPRRLSVALLLSVAPNLLQHLPSAALAAVVIASAISLFEVTDLTLNLSHPALGILVIDSLFFRGCDFWCYPGNRLGRCSRRY